MMAQLRVPHHIAGMETSTVDPAYFHAASLVVQVLNVLFAFLLLRVILRQLARRYEWTGLGQARADWSAGAGALLFGIHPGQVEAVAWITGLTDLLGAGFSFLALWQYLGYAEDSSDPARRGRGRRRYAVAILCYALALLSKPSAVATAVLALLLERLLIRGRLRQSLISLAPWFVMAVMMVLITRWAEPVSSHTSDIPVWGRAFVAGDAIAFYLKQLFLPLDFGIDYGRSPHSVMSTSWGYVAWMVPAGIAALIALGRKRYPWLVVAAVVFVAAFLPVLGLIPFRFQFYSTVSDRYSYLPMFGPAIALAGVLARLRSRSLLPASGVVVAALLFLGLQTSVQVVYWQTNMAIFRHSIAVNPRSAISHMNLALCLYQPQMPPIVNEELERAVELQPLMPWAHYNLGYVLLYEKRFREADTQLRTALAEDPTLSSAQSALGLTLLNEGQWAAAAEHLTIWLREQPDDAKGRFYLGSAYARMGRTADAVTELEESVRLDPDFPPAANELKALTSAHS
jgi:hypothetical protein